MKQTVYAFTLLGFIFLTACSGGDKKVLVMSSGKMQINGNTVNLTPGSSHNEATVTPSGDSVVVISPSGRTAYPVTENGLHLLNLKNDTLVGSYQRVGTDNSQQVITQENLRFRIDSLQRLLQGTNVSAEARNFSILPSGITRVTSNTSAQIIGPYVMIPGSFDPSREHEVYKFYTGKEMRGIIANLDKMVDRSGETGEAE